jgi:hypothetical protein
VTTAIAVMATMTTVVAISITVTIVIAVARTARTTDDGVELIVRELETRLLVHDGSLCACGEALCFRDPERKRASIGSGDSLIFRRKRFQRMYTRL